MLDETLEGVGHASEKSALFESVDWDFCQDLQTRIYSRQILTSGI